MPRNILADEPRQPRNILAAIPGSDNLDPSQIPPRDVPIPFREHLRGTVGEMLQGIPVAGPVLLKAGQMGGALKRSLTGDAPYQQALDEGIAEQERFRHDRPAESASSQAAGATAAMTGLSAVLPRLLGVTGGNLLTRMGLGGLSHGAIFGADEAVRGGNPETGAITGGIAGMLGPIFSQFITPSGPPTQALRARATDAIQRFRSAGAVVSQPRVTQLMDDMLAAGRAVGMRPRATARTWELTDDIQALRGNVGTSQGVDLEKLYTLRQDLGRIERLTDPIGSNEHAHDRMAAGKIGDVFDDFMDKISPADVVAGNPQQAQSALEEFRRTWGTLRKSELMEEVLHNAGIDASKYTQSGNENALRAQFRNVVKNPRLMRGFSPDERRALEKIATGSFVQNRFRDVGRFAVRGPLSALSAVAAGSVGGPIAGLGLAAAGEGGRQVATGIASKNARLAEALIRGGGEMPQLSQPRQAIRALIQELIASGGPTALRASGGGGF